MNSDHSVEVEFIVIEATQFFFIFRSFDHPQTDCDVGQQADLDNNLASLLSDHRDLEHQYVEDKGQAKIEC